MLRLPVARARKGLSEGLTEGLTEGLSSGRARGGEIVAWESAPKSGGGCVDCWLSGRASTDGSADSDCGVPEMCSSSA